MGRNDNEVSGAGGPNARCPGRLSDCRRGWRSMIVFFPVAGDCIRSGAASLPSTGGGPNVLKTRFYFLPPVQLIAVAVFLFRARSPAATPQREHGDRE